MLSMSLSMRYTTSKAISMASRGMSTWQGGKQWMIADVCIVPMGVGTGVSKYVTEVEREFSKFNVKTKLHAYGTNIEGEWDEVMAAVKAAHARLHEMGAPRISSNMRFGTRLDKAQTMEDKVKVVEDELSLHTS